MNAVAGEVPSSIFNIGDIVRFKDYSEWLSYEGQSCVIIGRIRNPDVGLGFHVRWKDGTYAVVFADNLILVQDYSKNPEQSKNYKKAEITNATKKDVQVGDIVVPFQNTNGHNYEIGKEYTVLANAHENLPEDAVWAYNPITGWFGSALKVSDCKVYKEVKGIKDRQDSRSMEQIWNEYDEHEVYGISEGISEEERKNRVKETIKKWQDDDNKARKYVLTVQFEGKESGAQTVKHYIESAFRGFKEEKDVTSYGEIDIVETAESKGLNDDNKDRIRKYVLTVHFEATEKYGSAGGVEAYMEGAFSAFKDEKDVVSYGGIDVGEYE